jgi:hypothetical protein
MRRSSRSTAVFLGSLLMLLGGASLLAAQDPDPRPFHSPSLPRYDAVGSIGVPDADARDASSWRPASGGRLTLRVGGGAVVHDAGQGLLSVGAAISVMRGLEVRSDLGFGFGDGFDSRTASGALLLMPFSSGGVEPYVGGGVALYREASDAAGTRFARSAPAWMGLLGVQARVGGPALFVEARAMGGRYGGDEFIRATSFTLPQVVAGVAIHPFGL